MGDPVDDVKKAANQLIDRWGSEVERISKALDKVLADLAAMEKAKDEDKPKQLKLTLTRDQLCKALKDCTDDFNVRLRDIKIPPKADPKLLDKLPDVVKEGIKRKGIPIGKNVTIVPKPDVDLKGLKFKGGAIDLKIHF